MIRQYFVPLLNASYNNIPSRLKSAIVSSRITSFGLPVPSGTRSRSRRTLFARGTGVPRTLWYEERVATQQDRSSTWDIPSSSLAKVGNPLGGVSYCLTSLALYSLLSSSPSSLPPRPPLSPPCRVSLPLSRSTRIFVSFLPGRLLLPSFFSLLTLFPL